MKVLSLISSLLIALLVGCAPLTSENEVTAQSTEIPTPGLAASCPDISGVWLGMVTDKLNDVEFSNPWGLILEQDGCQTSGRLAANPDGPVLDCVVENEKLTCRFNAGEDCANTVVMNISGDQLSGVLTSCFATESKVELSKSIDPASESFLGEGDEPGEFSAEPYPPGCWVHSFYKPGFITTFCDKFDDNFNDWQLGSGSGSLALTGAAIENGKLILDISGMTAGGEVVPVFHVLPPFTTADEFILQATGRIKSESERTAWGLAFEGEYSRDSLSYYFFMISNSGQFTLQEFNGLNLSPIIAPTVSDAIYAGQDNIIAVINNGSHYEFYINGVLVNSLELKPLQGNGLMLVASVAEGESAEFELDDLLVRSPRE